MKRRITLEMVKAKNPNMESINNITDSWIEEFREKGIDDDVFEFYIAQIFGALYMDNINPEDRIDILKHVMEDFWLTLLTPRAWDYCVEITKKELFENLEYNKEFKAIM